MTKPTTLDKIQEALLSPPHKTVKLDKREQAIRERYEKAFSFWQQNPHLPDKKIVNFLVNQCGVSRSLAYLDLRNIKYLLGCVRTLSKEWYRHMVIEMCRSAYSIAKIKRDAKAMALAADKIGKYAKLDKDEDDPLPWDQLIPPNFEPKPDVNILGIKPVSNLEEYRKKLRRKYLAKYDPNHFQEAVVVDNEN
jgi:hypothetical protein